MVTDAPMSVSPDNESLTYPLSVYLFWHQDTSETGNSNKNKSLFIVIFCRSPASHSPHCRASIYLLRMDYRCRFYRLASSRPCYPAPPHKTDSILFVHHTSRYG